VFSPEENKQMQELFFMCRHNQFWGFLLMAFGLGIFIGTWLKNGFLCSFVAFGLVAIGFCIARK
jgi:protein-S-isoprenylcysteine O-methyltransferase Ste14